MKQQNLSRAIGGAVLGALAIAGSASAGDTPGFCAGVTPPAPDIYEPNNTFETAKPLSPYAELPLELNFSDADDVDWFFFRAFNFNATGNVYPVSFMRPGFGSGIPLSITEPFQGAGVFIRIFRVGQTGNTEIIPPVGDPGSVEPIDQGCFEEPIDLEFRFESDGDYAISISQCRNENLDINGNLIADDEEYCVPDMPTYGLEIFEPVQFQGGRLEGNVTDAMTMQPLSFAAILGTNLGLTAYSFPGTGAYSGLATQVQNANADVILDGYETQAIQFDLVQDQTTDCDIALMPSGVNMSSDLSVSMFSSDPSQVAGGDAITLNTQVLNSGSGMSPATTLRFYLSTDNSIEPTDTELGSAAIVGLGAAGTASDLSQVSAPLTAGDFFVGACIDTVSGETNAANNCSQGAPLSIDYLFANGFETPAAAVNKVAPPACTLL